MEDEDFFLGDSLDSLELFLGDSTSDEDSFQNSNENAIHQNEINKTTQENSSPVNDSNRFNSSKENDDEKTFDEVVKIYEILKIEEKPFKTDFEEYFKNNPEIFTVVGSQYYMPLSKKQFESFEKKRNALIACAHKKWIGIENQRKLEDFDSALGTLYSIFHSTKKTEAYSKEIKRTLNDYLRSLLFQRTKDEILDVTEIQDLIDYAISIHLISDTKKGRTALFDWISKIQAKRNFKIETFEETFIRNVMIKPKIECMNTDRAKKKLLKKYRTLAEIDAKVWDKGHVKSDDELLEDMCRLMSGKKLFVSNVDLFLTEFLEDEIQKKGEFFFTVPISSEYYYYLKGTATNRYDLTNDQWRQLTMIRNIRLESEYTVAFIMGYKKESTVEGIVRMLEENPSFAATRILAGDLETYFSHIGRGNLSAKIAGLKVEHKSDESELVKEVVNTLKSEFVGYENYRTKSDNEKKDFVSLMENNADLRDFVDFTVKNKSDEQLIEKLLSSDSESETFKSYLSSRNHSYTKFILNVMNELLLEPDISQYRFAFIKAATKALEHLARKKDFLSFANIYLTLVRNAVSIGLMESESEIPGYESTEKEMLDLYGIPEIIDTKKSNDKKKKFSFFGIKQKK